MRIVKRLVLTMFVVVALLGCKKEHVETPTPPNDAQAISFGSVTTRAIVSDKSQIGEFKVWGELSNSTVDKFFIFEGRRVFSNDDGVTWDYDAPYRYWVQDSDYVFFSAYPYATDVTVDATGEATKYIITDFTTPTDKDNPVDLMTSINSISTYPNGEGEYEYAPVPVDFRHELTKVNIVVTQDYESNPSEDWRFRINRATLNNIKGKGTLTVTAPIPSNGGGTGSYSWALSSSTPISFTYNGSNTGDGDFVIYGDELALFGDGLVLIPQPANSIYLYLEYDFGRRDGDGNITWEDRTATIYLPSSTQWLANTSISYALELREDNKMRFTQVTVATWGTNQNGGTIIIK